MRVFHPLQHLQFIIHHLFVALDILLKDDLDSIFHPTAIGFSHYAIRASTQCPTELILGPEHCNKCSGPSLSVGMDVLLIVAVRLARELVQHIGDCHVYRKSAVAPGIDARKLVCRWQSASMPELLASDRTLVLRIA